MRGKISQRLRSKTSKMKYEVPNVNLEVYTVLCRKNSVQELQKKRSTYYPMEEVLARLLLPDAFDPNMPESKRLWCNAKDPETGHCKTTYGWPKSANVNRPCELLYKPSDETLSVTCWNSETHSWEGLCHDGKTL